MPKPTNIHSKVAEKYGEKPAREYGHGDCNNNPCDKCLDLAIDKDIQKNKFVELKKTIQSDLDCDLVRAGKNFRIIERQNEAFARGWRWALQCVIEKLDEYV